MKNIHILPTDKPSRLCFRNYLFINKDNIGTYSNVEFKNIYITSDEEIKEGYVLNTFNNTVYKIVPDNSSREILANPTILPLYSINREHYFKIILTDNDLLIKDGVQAIDDEFLEWFVKNPTCEEVEIEESYSMSQSTYSGIEYEIIIPKEEPKQELSARLKNSLIQFNINLDEAFDLPDWKLKTIGFSNKSILELNKLKEESKQETLEEAAEKWVFETNSHKWSNNDNTAGDNYNSFIEGAKWQQERSYSEEEVKEQLNLILAMKNSLLDTFTDDNGFITDKWFEQFKNK